MIYYSIQHSLNTRIVGKFFQSEKILNQMGENSRFLNNFYFEKIDFIPITPMPILHKKAKITDLISNVNAGGSIQLIISEKLKNILIKYRNKGLQFFQTSIIKENTKNDNYFSLNMYEFNHEYIDFKNSIIYYEKNYRNPYTKEYSHTEKTEIKIKDFQEFMEYSEKAKATIDSTMDSIDIEKLILKQNIKDDFFALKYIFGSIYYVSEKLKKEIEDAGCTGIEFQPAELSTYEWHVEREKIYGKS